MGRVFQLIHIAKAVPQIAVKIFKLNRSYLSSSRPELNQSVQVITALRRGFICHEKSPRVLLAFGFKLTI